MSELSLHGMTWNHSRAFPPLVAASQRYVELHPNIRIEWDKRSLDEFGHTSLAELGRSYDLLIIDHPMLGEVHRKGTLLDLQARLPPAELAELEADALGLCLESYRYEGCLYALPVDAAAPAASYRADLLKRHGCDVPKRWDQLIELARSGAVRMPGFPADLFLNFLGMCITRNGMITSGERFLDPSTAALCLEELRELASFMPGAIYTMNPIDIYEAMTAGDEFSYCPFAYTYSNYSRPGFAAHTLNFANPVALSQETQLRTVLGGTGIAVSEECAHADAAIEFCLFVAGAKCQRHIYGICGGQPASKAAWRDPTLNFISNGFFQRTAASIEGACVRPRYAGYISLQRSAGHAITSFLRHEITAARSVERIEQMYRNSLVAKHDQEPAR